MIHGLPGDQVNMNVMDNAGVGTVCLLTEPVTQHSWLLRVTSKEGDIVDAATAKTVRLKVKPYPYLYPATLIVHDAKSYYNRPWPPRLSKP